MWSKFLKILKNKYVIASLILVIWISFFDNNDYFTRRKINKNLKELGNKEIFIVLKLRKTALLLMNY